MTRAGGASPLAPALAVLLLLSACANSSPDSSSSQIEQPPPSPPPSQSVATLGGQTYSVVAGDTIDTVARQFGVPVDVLIQANGLASPYQLRPGQQLVIPVSGTYTVQPGDSLYKIAQKHNTTVSELAQLNGLAPPYLIRVGRQLTLPGSALAQGGTGNPVGDTMPPSTPAPSLPPAGTSVVTTESLAPPPGTSASPAPAATTSSAGIAAGAGTPSSTPSTATVSSSSLPALAPANPTAAPSASAVVASGSTGGMITTKNGQPVPAIPPASPGAIPALPPSSNGSSTSSKNPTVSQSVTNSTTPDQSATGQPATGQTGGGQATGNQTASVGTPPATHGTGKFLWPVNGKIVSAFGAKDGGQHNDGINIAAPLGTPVHAADAGVVVYAGNELRGFGNLLLVRHADGWVSAYAHCDALLVKRGENVKRGQVIARVGQSGNVTAPQLHFELRKGAEAVDPLGQLGPQGA